jgi:hypothetical protein
VREGFVNSEAVGQMLSAVRYEGVETRFAFHDISVMLTRIVMKKRNACMVLAIHPVRINVKMDLNVSKEFARHDLSIQ